MCLCTERQQTHATLPSHTSSAHTYIHNERTSRQTNSWRGAPDGQQLTVLTEL